MGETEDTAGRGGYGYIQGCLLPPWIALSSKEGENISEPHSCRGFNLLQWAQEAGGGGGMPHHTPSIPTHPIMGKV